MQDMKPGIVTVIWFLGGKPDSAYWDMGQGIITQNLLPGIG
jgi:hypothetical protein